MPRHKKKKFIDKNHALSFKLQNRSQRDPLSVDEGAPQNVLTAMGSNVGFSDLASETTAGRMRRWRKQREYGIGYDDDYDYMQHLRESDHAHTAVLTPLSNPPTKHKHGRPVGTIAEEDEDVEEEDEEDEMVDITRDEKAVLQLPSVVFPSEVEAEKSLWQKVKLEGPLFDWDPDIVETLDDDFNFDDPQNPDVKVCVKKEGGKDEEGEAFDEFFKQVVKGAQGDDDDEVDSRDGDFASDDDDIMTSYDDDDDEDERASRFTGYSLTSSKMRRNEQLQILDAKLEVEMKKFLSPYDEEKEEKMTWEDLVERGITSELFPEKEGSGKESVDLNKGMIMAKFEYERDHDEDLVYVYKQVPRIKHDCVSILSTRSNLYNHPATLDAPSLKQLKKQQREESKEKAKIAEEKSESLDEEEKETKLVKKNKIVVKEVVEAQPNAPQLTRQKGESAEEKKARKQAMKDFKKERRMQKKATKLAFATQKKQVKQEMAEINKNIDGIKIQ